MDFDARGMAVGIAGGTVLGTVLWLLVDNTVLIGLFAAIGAVIGMNSSWFNRGDQE